MCVFSFSAAEGWVLNKNMSILSHTAEGRWRGHSYQLTTIRSRHHGVVVVLAGTKFLSSLCPWTWHLRGFYGRSIYTQMRVKCWV